MFSNNINLLAPFKFDSKLSLFIDCLHDFSTYNVVGGFISCQPNEKFGVYFTKTVQQCSVNQIHVLFLIIRIPINDNCVSYIRNYANNYSYLANNWHIYKCAGVIKVSSQEHFLNLIGFAEFSLIIFPPYDLNCATFKIE